MENLILVIKSKKLNFFILAFLCGTLAIFLLTMDSGEIVLERITGILMLIGTALMIFVGIRTKIEFFDKGMIATYGVLRPKVVLYSDIESFTISLQTTNTGVFRTTGYHLLVYKKTNPLRPALNLPCYNYVNSEKIKVLANTKNIPI